MCMQVDWVDVYVLRASRVIETFTAGVMGRKEGY